VENDQRGDEDRPALFAGRNFIVRRPTTSITIPPAIA